MKINISIVVLLLIITTVKAQVFGTQEMVEEENISLKIWEENDTNMYAGTYSFGESEGESSILISISNGIVCAQLEEGNWAIENSKIMGWHMSYKNFTNVKIKGNQFYSDQSNGAFVTFEAYNTNHKGLQLFNPPLQMGSKDHYEIGSFSEVNEIGIYFDTKTEIIPINTLNKMSLEELNIMRNEIYARYHYRFKTKKMLDYFNKQEWYSGYHDNVDLFLDKIEKENLNNIRVTEKNKK